MSAIAGIRADWVLDSRARPSIEVSVELEGGAVVFAQCPSGRSTGRHESRELRDDDADRFDGMGVTQAISGIRNWVTDALIGFDVTDQARIDQLLVELDGTEDRSRLGANAILAVSAACARAGALALGSPLWAHLAGLRTPRLPMPMVNMISGNLHARGGMSIQDVLIMPVGAQDVETALEWVHDVYHSCRRALDERGFSVLVGDEGGFGAPMSSEEALELVVDAISRAGRKPGEEVALTIDVAGTHILQPDGSYLLDGQILSSLGLIEVFKEWIDRFPIISIEDPLGEDDWDAWCDAATHLASRVQLVGDDLICTHLHRLEMAAELGCANAVLVKPNQIGTLSEALSVVDKAAELGMATIVSARSGETEDDWLADFAIASGAGSIKVGSVARSERLAKYNRLMRVGRQPNAPRWAGSPQWSH